MKLRIPHVISFLIMVLILSGSTAFAFKAEWSIDAPGGGYDYEIFNVEKDGYFVQMSIEVTEGGPVSVFILDEFAVEDLFSYGQPVTAYIGDDNISQGNRRTLTSLCNFFIISCSILPFSSKNFVCTSSLFLNSLAE